MKRDPRLKRSGERVLLGYGGMHRRPRYNPCPLHRSTIIARVARSMRIPVGILGLGLTGTLRAAGIEAARLEREALMDVVLGSPRHSGKRALAAELDRDYPRWIGAQVQEL